MLLGGARLQRSRHKLDEALTKNTGLAQRIVKLVRPGLTSIGFPELGPTQHSRNARFLT
jgi:hypothetical protein